MQRPARYRIISIVCSEYFDQLAFLPPYMVQIDLLPLTKMISHKRRVPRRHAPNILNAKRNVGSLNDDVAIEAFGCIIDGRLSESGCCISQECSLFCRVGNYPSETTPWGRRCSPLRCDSCRGSSGCNSPTDNSRPGCPHHELHRMDRGFQSAGTGPRPRKFIGVDRGVAQVGRLRPTCVATPQEGAFASVFEQGGGSPPQVDVPPACSRPKLRRREAGWGASGGEWPVRNASELDSAGWFGEPALLR